MLKSNTKSKEIVTTLFQTDEITKTINILDGDTELTPGALAKRIDDWRLTYKDPPGRLFVSMAIYEILHTQKAGRGVETIRYQSERKLGVVVDGLRMEVIVSPLIEGWHLG